MKALAPTMKNKLIFALAFNIFMLLIYYLVDLHFTWKNVAAINIIVICFILNWLPKTPAQMDEREKIEYIKAGNNLFTLSMVSIVSVFLLHLLWLDQMSIAQFMLFSGIPVFIGTSMYSYKFKREFSLD